MKYKLILLVICFNTLLLAQYEKYPVEILDNSYDRVGESLVYQIKEKLRESNSLRLTIDDENRLQIDIKTMSYEDSRVLTIYSIIWILKPVDQLPIFYDSTLGYVGSDRINNVAISIVAQTDKLLDNLRKALKELDSNSRGY